MARYSELYMGDELTKLRDGLEMLERVVDFDVIRNLNIWLYGIVTDTNILDIAKASLADEENSSSIGGDLTVDVSESDVELYEIAVGVPITSTDSIDILYGRGVPLRDLSFVYQAGDGEGIRTSSFLEAHNSDTIRIDDMEIQAFADGEEEMYNFLNDKGNKTRVMKIRRKVQRNEEATEAEPVKGPTPISKQTSLTAILENFLG